MTRPAPLLAFLWVLGAAGLAEARERLAVLIVVDGDPVLADNLTEVVISKVAEGRDRELVGLRELRGRLARSSKATPWMRAWPGRAVCRRSGAPRARTAP